MKSVQPNKSPRERREALLKEKRASSCTVDFIVRQIDDILRRNLTAEHKLNLIEMLVERVMSNAKHEGQA